MAEVRFLKITGGLTGRSNPTADSLRLVSLGLGTPSPVSGLALVGNIVSASDGGAFAISYSAAATAAGGALSITGQTGGNQAAGGSGSLQAGAGGASIGGAAGGVGGALTLSAGAGGAGSGAQTPGAGGAATLTGANAGTGGTGTALGGNVVIDAGLGSTAVAGDAQAGLVQIGKTRAKTIEIGSTVPSQILCNVKTLGSVDLQVANSNLLHLTNNGADNSFLKLQQGSSYIEIGSAPATSGALRLSDGNEVRWRISGTNHTGLQMNSSGFFVGSTLLSTGPLFLQTQTTQSARFVVGSTTVMVIDGSNVTLGNASGGGVANQELRLNGAASGTGGRLRMRDTTDPTPVADNGFIYMKDVGAGVIELFYQGEAGAPEQISGGGGGGASLAATLAIGNLTGGNPIRFTSGDNVELAAVDGTGFSVTFGAAATSTAGAISITGQTSGGTAAGGDVTFRGGNSNSTGAGGIATVRGGDGASGTGAGGLASLRGGNALATGAGGLASVRGGDSTGAVGGGARLRGGDGVVAGAVTITGGTPSAGDGGAVGITASDGVGMNNNGGAITLIAGAAPTGAGTAGAISLFAGAADTNTGGEILLRAGTPTTSGVGGPLNLFAGNAAGGNPGGGIGITAGSGGTGASNGGVLSLTSGAAGPTGAGGALNLTGGAGGATSGAGGIVTLKGGDSTSGGQPGSVVLRGGDSAGAGIPGGYVELRGGTRGTGATSDVQMFVNSSTLILQLRASTAGVSQIGFFGTSPAPRPAAYTVSNLTTDRSYDANATTLDELADVLGTLITDLQAYGLLQ